MKRGTAPSFRSMLREVNGVDTARGKSPSINMDDPDAMLPYSRAGDSFLQDQLSSGYEVLSAGDPPLERSALPTDCRPVSV